MIEKFTCYCCTLHALGNGVLAIVVINIDGAILLEIEHYYVCSNKLTAFDIG